MTMCITTAERSSWMLFIRASAFAVAAVSLYALLTICRTV